MANRTGLLALQSQHVTNWLLLSKILSAALQKVEQNLYLQITPDKAPNNQTGAPSSDDVVAFNKMVNQIYLVSSKKAPRVDTRVILRQFRDAINNINDIGKFTLHHKVDLELSVASLIDGELDQEPGQFTDLDVNVALPHVQNVADPGKIYDNVVLGGTFDRLHAGHKMLLSAAILRCAKKLTIGVTDGPMIRSKKLFELIEPCQLRIEKLREFLEDIEPRICYNIVPIVDPYGPTGEDPDLQMLVVSEETLQGGHKVNNLRQERGLSVLDIHTIPLVEDAMATKHEENKISSSSARKRLLGTHIKPPKGKGKPYIIGLTGGIASGKTSICARLKNLGVHSISCDHLGHQAYKKGTNCHRQMVEYFGDVILDDGGEIDRKKLGPVVFSDKAHLEKLNAMVWPEIRRLYLEEIETLKRQGFEGVIVLDAAILLEAGWDQDCHEVWVSIVPPSEAVQRIMERDKLSSEQATKRIESQLSNSERVLRANVVLCSVWEPEVTGQQVELAWRQVQRYLADSN